MSEILSPAQWVKKHRHDELKARLEKLAEQWDNEWKTEGLYEVHLCAEELREVLE